MKDFKDNFEAHQHWMKQCNKGTSRRIWSFILAAIIIISAAIHFLMTWFS